MRHIYLLAFGALTGLMADQATPNSPAWIALVRTLGPCLLVLFAMTVLDIASGLAGAYIAHNIDPDVILRGAAKKSFAFIVILGVAAIELGVLGWLKFQYGKEMDFPLNPTVAATAYYCLAELASILRNAHQAGAPLPPFLARLCYRLSPQPTGRKRR